MFQISIIEDKAVRILPQNLALKQLEAVTQQLEATYIDKVRAARAGAPPSAPTAGRQVIPELGLAVTLYEVLRIDGGAVHPGEGSALFTVLFSLVIFRPFLGEVLTGRIKSSSKSGVQVSDRKLRDAGAHRKLSDFAGFLRRRPCSAEADAGALLFVRARALAALHSAFHCELLTVLACSCEGEQPDEQAHWKWVWEENDMHMDNDEEARLAHGAPLGILTPPWPDPLPRR
jgi:hypothetical protein